MRGRVVKVYIVGQGGQPVTLRGRVARVYIAISKTSYTVGQDGQGVHCLG